jgi:hypothetical protein
MILLCAAGEAAELFKYNNDSSGRLCQGQAEQRLNLCRLVDELNEEPD